MNKILYQCPYEAACMCDMEEPCNGCETWAIALREERIKTNEPCSCSACQGNKLSEGKELYYDGRFFPIPKKKCEREK